MSDPIQIGPYTVMNILSYNNVSQTCVYMARHDSTNQTVVIKMFITLSGDEKQTDDIRRFHREISIISSLHHPNILSPIDFGDINGRVYYVMPFMEGRTLAHMILEKSLELDRITEILRQVTAALGYAHEKGIVHRDLKPNNILFDASGNAYLADFGVAKTVDGGATRLTKTGSLVGTPYYMSPEQWLNEDLDIRTDLYALGVVLFEMLTRQAPFCSDNISSLMTMHLYSPPPRVTEFRPDLPGGLVRMLDKALAKSPEKRYVSAEAFFQGYQEALETQFQLRLVPKKHLVMPVNTHGHTTRNLKLDNQDATVQFEVPEDTSTVEMPRTYEPPPRRWMLTIGIFSFCILLVCFVILFYVMR